jgi:hypothetical protein
MSSEPLHLSPIWSPKDLDLTNLGGSLTWLKPTNAAQVESYVAYLAEACQDRRFPCRRRFR